MLAHNLSNLPGVSCQFVTKRTLTICAANPPREQPSKIYYIQVVGYEEGVIWVRGTYSTCIALIGGHPDVNNSLLWGSCCKKLACEKIHSLIVDATSTSRDAGSLTESHKLCIVSTHHHSLLQIEIHFKKGKYEVKTDFLDDVHFFLPSTDPRKPPGVDRVSRSSGQQLWESNCIV